MKKFKQDMQEPWDNHKRCYICILGKRKERGMEETIETMMIGNFLKLMTATGFHGLSMIVGFAFIIILFLIPTKLSLYFFMTV